MGLGNIEFTNDHFRVTHALNAQAKETLTGLVSL